MWITSLFKVTEKDKSEYALLCKLAYQCALSYLLLLALI